LIVFKVTIDAQDMLQNFENLGLAAKTIIRERKVYRDAIVEGKGVLEMANPKANNEIKSLVEEVLQ
jgi:chromosome partitioning protein